GREEDSAFSRNDGFRKPNVISHLSIFPFIPFSIFLSLHSSLRQDVERTIPPPYPLPSLQERRGS
ncbi:MAG: hypothetical protein ACI4UO_05360, partial [Paludibacteraceae bacterium]